VVRPLESNISDGLIMRVDNEGVFLDDDRKMGPLRQWDIKLWTMKGVEVSFGPTSLLFLFRLLIICSRFLNLASTSYVFRYVIRTIPKWYTSSRTSRHGKSPTVSSA
jgi:hypothetical protein